MLRWMGLLLLAARFTAGEGDLLFDPEPYLCGPLELKLGRPQGWEASLDSTGLMLFKGDAGCRVTREPFLYDPESFSDIWTGQLAAAGKEGKAVRCKFGKFVAWQTAYRADQEKPRRLEIWRLYVPETEMLYNFRFSLPDGVDARPLAEGVLRGFGCTGTRPKLEIPDKATPISTRWYIRLPKGFISEAEAGVRLGGGSRTSFLKLMGGYEPVRESARIAIAGIDARYPTQTEGGKVIQGNALDEWAGNAWTQAQGQFNKVTEKPKGRERSYGDLKGGQELVAAGLDKGGVPREFYSLCAKVSPSENILVTLIVDARETRLHKDLFKQICSSIFKKES